jgi:hypothetical protein
MKVYTYYEDIGGDLQPELLEVWSRSWRVQGFDPVILSREDAERSSLFQQYYDFVQRIHDKSVGKILKEKGYWLAAQLEVVAFHTIEKPSYASDYDMINNGFRTGEEVESLVHWRNDACSCFSSGDKIGWERYIRFLFEQESSVVDWCVEENKRTSRTEFGDQDFLLAVREKGIKNGIYKMYRNLDIAGEEYKLDGPNNCLVIHLPHNNMGQIKAFSKDYQKYTTNQMRLMLANKICERLNDEV